MASSVLAPAPYKIVEVAGEQHAGTLRRLNGMFKDEFYDLDDNCLENGWWFLIMLDADVVGFAGSVTFEPFREYGYIKRTAVLKDHRGHGEGDDDLCRFFDLALLGELVSLHLAAREGVDPGPTPVVDEAHAGAAGS